ncbi:FAD binding domain-containing protein [Seiridium cupressi]
MLFKPHLAAFFLVLQYASAAYTAKNVTSDCYCLPQDACWPSIAESDALNTTVNGRLIATVPIGSVCHEPTYDEAACVALRAEWNEPEPHCNPLADRSTPCRIGNLISYAVNISNTDEIAETIKFAKTHNVRLVVRNTGHDFVGRSTGAGGLAVWTHHLKSLEVIQTFEIDAGVGKASYSGPALKMGSGVQGFEAESFASQSGLVVVGGWCPSVGIAGGYTQGGGHSPLGSQFGMAADQTLEFEVVTVNGSVVTASPRENSDLYWALSGGGPGTYGVVTSVTVRAHPDLPIGGASVYITNDLTFPNATTILDNYWITIKTWYSLLPNLTDSGIGATFSYNNSLFLLNPLTAHNMTSDEIKTAIKPWTDQLDYFGITYSATFTDMPNYYTHWNTFVAPGPVGGFWQAIARIVPERILSDVQSLTAFANVARDLADQGAFAGATAVAPKKKTNFDNAVLPAWRGAAGLHGLLQEWSDNPSLWDEMQNMLRNADSHLSPALKSVTGGTAGPGSWDVGSYVNAVSGVEPDWKDESFGQNWEKLLQVKRKWDPEGISWGPRLVGSEDREVVDNPRDIGDGRLCKVGH